MICYATSGYTIFSLRKLKVYGDCGPGAECPASDIRAGGQITQKLYFYNIIRTKQVIFYIKLLSGFLGKLSKS